MYFNSLVEVVSQRISELVPGESLLVLLEGPLGVGKTQFVKELLGRYGYPAEEVQSPTFLKIIEHRVDGVGKVLHLDLYRLDEPAEIEKLDLEAFEDPRLILVEWPRLLIEHLAHSPRLKSSLGIRQRIDVLFRMSESGERAWSVRPVSR